VFEPAAAQVRLELLAHEPGQRGVALGEILKERLGVLLDGLVEQRFLRPVARVTLLRRIGGGEAVRIWALDGEHPSDWSAPPSWAHGVIGASWCRFCPCHCQRRVRTPSVPGLRTRRNKQWRE